MKKLVVINDKKAVIDWYKTAFLEQHLQRYKSKVLDCKKVIEIGAYDCQESLKFTSLFPKATVTAFECNPRLINKCKENSEKSDRITLVEGMVTNIPENNTLYLCEGGLSSMCYPMEMEHALISVPTIKMEKYLDDSQIDFLWIDVQGAELNVLQSFGHKLQNVKTIYCEVDITEGRYATNSNMNTVSEFLFNNGYLIKDKMILNPNEAHLIFEC